MTFALSKILDVLVEPLFLAIVLVAIGLRRPATRATRAAPVVGLLVLLVFALEPVSNALVRSLEVPASPLREGRVYDAVVLLGGPLDARATEDSGLRSYHGSAERLLVTAELLREGRARFAVLSGGRADPETRTPESHVLRDALVSLGIDVRRIVIEDRSRNTRENAEQTRRVVAARGLRSVLVVTSAFHVVRAREAFADVGLRVDMYPCDFRSFDPAKHRVRLLPRASFLADSTFAIREHVGRLVHRLVSTVRRAWVGVRTSGDEVVTRAHEPDLRMKRKAQRADAR